MRTTAITVLCILGTGSCISAQQNRPVADCLAEGGYIEIQLSRNGSGQFETFVELDSGDKLRVLVDTGASRTFFGIEKMKKLRYRLRNTTIKLHTMSGEQQVKSTDVKFMKLGGAQTGPMTMYCTNLDYVNRVLEQNGNNPVEGVLGSDLMTMYSAVIDIKNSKLFLKFE